MGPLYAVLLVDDDAALRAALRKVLSVPYDVHAVGDLASAREALATTRFDVAILDKGLPDGEGSELIADVKRCMPLCAVIMMTGDREFRSVTHCLALGADDYTIKSENLVAELLIRIPVAVRFAALKVRADRASADAPRAEKGPRLPESVAELKPEAYERYVFETEKQFLAAALGLLDGDATRTAQALGIAKSTMFKKMATHGLPRRAWTPAADLPSTRRDT